ncbi:hypothetical protein EDD70_0444 [Hydrogenoanaerobacterium saccharovorans]|uniref:Lipoprotein n=1 Tax=Hydrogenoanaerobacterium saccharovorans TaxID=474960 RepID=A0A1H8B0M5_9FIRM|nr:hypothetical protein [Hydrogenoanaerobacterium saccharovorans]RPF47650.1 hypothetical protein EDD70_0444 [Hydrogenoanaerobacterium saccharovorans]SEM76465.1 hypothetical protein SAMN05216180_1649 [Hydrogenoanaerobacterium saccharovorans]
MKNIIAVAFMVLLLSMAGCGIVKKVPSAETSSALSSSQTQSSTSSETEQENNPYTEEASITADQAAQGFVDALKKMDTLDLETYGNPERFKGKEGSYNYLKAVKLNSISYTKIQSEDSIGVYELTLDVADAGGTLLKTGSHKYIMRAGPPPYDLNPAVLSITPAEKYIADEVISADAAAHQLTAARDWGCMWQPFTSPEELNKEIDIDYLIGLNGDPNGLTQERLNELAKKYYGLDSYVHTDSRFYNKHEKRYELLGRCGATTNERVVRIEGTEQDKVIYIEFYDDPIQIVLKETLAYTMAQNDDGTYRYVSIKSVEKIA